MKKELILKQFKMMLNNLIQICMDLPTFIMELESHQFLLQVVVILCALHAVEDLPIPKSMLKINAKHAIKRLRRELRDQTLDRKMVSMIITGTP